MEATGQWCVTDGENRASSFATYPITDTLMGAGLAETLAPDGQYLWVYIWCFVSWDGTNAFWSAIFDDGSEAIALPVMHLAYW